MSFPVFIMIFGIMIACISSMPYIEASNSDITTILSVFIPTTLVKASTSTVILKIVVSKSYASLPCYPPD